MNNAIRKLVSPILDFFESGDEEYLYRKSHRLILRVVGGLFLFLALVSALTGLVASLPGAIIPVLVFLAVGVVSTVVGTLGNDRAVARIWGSRKDGRNGQ
ncbi:MAG: hypothetical protein ACQETO_09355 [Pseudomonadota bacterium]